MRREKKEAVVAKSLWNMNFLMEFGKVSDNNALGGALWYPEHAGCIRDLAQDGSWGFDNEQK